MNKGDVVQFNENHKWCGCLGIIEEQKECKTKNAPKGDIRYMISVSIPQQGAAYIYVLASEFAIEKIGKARLVLKDD